MKTPAIRPRLSRRGLLFAASNVRIRQLRVAAAADVLVSPRLQGRNTPMRVYSYMQAGRAIVATAIPTHTQVLDDSCALLAAPTPESYADALSRASDAETRDRLGQAAREKCAREYGMPAFERAMDALVAAIDRARGA